MMPETTRLWLAACLLLSTAGQTRILAALGQERGPGAAAPDAAATPAEVRGDGVYNAVEGETTIVFLKPEGSQVKKGELVCELESFAVRTKLAGQESATRAAQGPYENARRDRELAEFAITAYIEAEFLPQLKTIERDISLAEDVLKRALDALATAKRLVEKGLGPRSRADTAELNVQQARFALEKLQRKKETLQKYTREKRVKELQSKVERARAFELARQAELGREQAVLDQLKKQLERCKLLAPADGRIGYPDGIEEGASVNQGQLLFRVFPEAASKAAGK
jgi:multidrug resistance efflux pump